MKYEEFNKSINSLKEFIKEQDKLENVLKVLSPSSTGVCEFGNKFIDDYINLLEIALRDETNSVSWFVFDNDFGNKKMKVGIDDIEFEISNDKEFYDFCLKKLK